MKTEPVTRYESGTWSAKIFLNFCDRLVELANEGLGKRGNVRRGYFSWAFGDLIGGSAAQAGIAFWGSPARHNLSNRRWEGSVFWEAFKAKLNFLNQT
jgi:hypothetical protein